MKVLLVFPQKDKQTGFYIKESFQELGCQLKVVDAKTNPGDIYPATKSFRPSLIFCSRTHQLLPGLKKIRKEFKGCKVAIWNVDKRNNVVEFDGRLLELFNHCDMLYTIAKGNVDQYKEVLRHKKVRFLQQGCHPSVHKTEDLTKEDHEKYDCEVMFAGSTASCGGTDVHQQRSSLFQVLSESKYDFKRFGSNKETQIWDDEHNKACQCAKIVLGHNGWPDVEISMSVRDYKIMGAGGFLLTQRCKNIENWFPVGEVCDVYETEKECLEKIDYWLNHPKKRQRAAMAAQKLVYEKHTYKHRIANILDDYRRGLF